MPVANRQQFADFCIRALGGGVINIEVSDEQIDDRIDDAINFMIDYNYNMMEKKFLAFQITQDDIDNGFLTMPQEVLAVSKILPIRSSTSPNSSNFLFDLRYHLTANALLNTYGTGDVSQFYITKQYISTVNDIFTNQPDYEFRRFTDKLYFHFDAEERLFVNDFIVIECHVPIDSASRFWEDRLLKQYATALIKRQWASNLSKFQKVQLPGGVELNGTELYTQAQLEIDKVEEMTMSMSEMPPFIIG